MRDKAKRLSSTLFQRNIGETIDRVRREQDHVMLTAHGRPQAVILPVRDYEELQEIRREHQAWLVQRLIEPETAPEAR